MPQLEERAKPRTPIVESEIDKSGNSMHSFLAIVLMVLAIVAMFNPIIFGGKTLSIGAEHCSSILPGGAYASNHQALPSKQFCPDPWAESSQTEPWLKFTGWSYFTEHKIPHWNPYVGCGMPFLANMQSQPFYPLHVFSSLFASSLALNFFVLARLLVGGVCTFFALRFLLPAKDSALLGAIGFMFTGYLLLYLNMSEISVAVLIPALILGAEVVVRRPSVGSVALCSGLVALNLFGGMPESSFIAIVFAGFYVLARLSTLSGWSLRLRTLGLIAVAYLAGLMFALPQVLPFLEYMRLSVNSHDPGISGLTCGLEHDADWRRGVLSYLFPVAWAKKYFARGFYGVALGYLAMLGCSIAALRVLRSKHDRVGSVMMLFFGAAFLVMLLKRFGCPLVQWIGVLPLADMVLFPKYDEPIMSLCIAALASFGVSALQRREVNPKIIVALSVGFWLLASLLYLMYRREVMIPNFDLSKDMGMSMKLGLGALGATVLSALVSWKVRIVRLALPILLAIPFFCETYFGYMCQTFYGPSGVVDSRLDPFKGAPYLDFMRNEADHDARAIGLDGVLRPSWSAVFNIMAPTYQDALCPSQYSQLLSTLLPNSGMDYRGRGFDGTENCVANLSGLRRFCALTSTKYILGTMSPIDRSDLIVANAQKTQLYSASDRICYVPDALIDGVKQTVTFQHPDLNPVRCEIKFPISVPVENAVLEFDFVRNPDTACPARQTPVEGLVEVSLPDSSQAPVRFSFVNSESAKLHATHYRLDVSKFSGRQVLVSLASRPKPGFECSWEWVGWKKLHLQEASTDSHQLALGVGADRIRPGACNAPLRSVRETMQGLTSSELCIYDKEVKIYEVKDVIPHAAVFSSANLADNDEEVLSTLVSQTFLPLHEVVFNQAELQPDELQTLAQLGPKAPCRAAKIIHSGSDELQISLPASTKPAFLLLTDTCYPGWRAFVDGNEARVLRANYCFRSILLPAGAKSVTFKYSSRLFEIGLLLSGLTLLAFACIGFRSRIATKKRAA